MYSTKETASPTTMNFVFNVTNSSFSFGGANSGQMAGGDRDSQRWLSTPEPYVAPPAYQQQEQRRAEPIEGIGAYSVSQFAQPIATMPRLFVQSTPQGSPQTQSTIYPLILSQPIGMQQGSTT